MRESVSKMIRKILMVLLGKASKEFAPEIAKAQKWIDSAQAQFAKAIEQAEQAEIEFERVAHEKMDKAEALISEANDLGLKVEQARKFKEKIKDLI